VSLRLKSELRLRLGAQRCDAEVWNAGLRARCVAQAHADGPPASAVDQTVTTLLAEGRALPAGAAVLLDDEMIFFALLPAARGGWAEAQTAARAHFEEKLGIDDLAVETGLLPGGKTWLSLALPAEELTTLQDTLSAHGIRLQQVQSALVDDLRHISASGGGGTRLLVLLRTEGATVIWLHQSDIVNIAWERFDWKLTDAVVARVQGHAALLSAQAGPGDAVSGPAIAIAPLDARQFQSLEPVVQDLGWRLLPPLREVQP
jgi:hypothetical protein